MDFNPTKSPHYKVVHATPIGDYFPAKSYWTQTYSSETGIWSIICSCSDPFEGLGDGIYWNDAIHWLSDDYYSFLHYKLDFGNKTVALTKIQLPVTMDTVGNHCILYESRHCKLFESRGCLLLLGMDKNHPKDQLNIYALRNGHPAWTLKYSVNHSRISSYGAICIQRVLCIALGVREEDSFMVIKLDGEVVLYKFVLKTFCELPELESMLSKRRDYSFTGSFLFTASFASV